MIIWIEPGASARLAASDLLDVLEEQTDAAQAVVDAWEKGTLPERCACLRAVSLRRARRSAGRSRRRYDRRLIDNAQLRPRVLRSGVSRSSVYRQRTLPVGPPVHCRGGGGVDQPVSSPLT